MMMKSNERRLLNIRPEILNGMATSSRPLPCICGSADLEFVEFENQGVIFDCIQCCGCGHSGPALYDNDYIHCVNVWNSQMRTFEDQLLED